MSEQANKPRAKEPLSRKSVYSAAVYHSALLITYYIIV